MRRIGIAGCSIGLVFALACSAGSGSVGAGGRGVTAGSGNANAAGGGNASNGGSGNANAGGSGNASNGGSGNANAGGSSNASNGGTTGSGGTSFGGATGAGGAAVGSTQIELSYASRSAASSNFVLPHILIENKVIYALPLNEIEIRYYWTLDGESTSTQTFNINNAYIQNPIGGSYVNLGSNGQMVMTVLPLDPSTATADHYLSITFQTDPPVLLRKTDVAELILDDYTQDQLNQSNDYSFNDSSGADTPIVWDKITVYRNGELVWGVPPS